MPEYPDITVYIERLEALVVGKPLEKIRFVSPFFLRTAEPPIKSIHDAVVHGLKRIAKQIVFVFDDERFLVLHLMVAGRLYWRDRLCKIPSKRGLAAFDFPCGSLLITEASSKNRAALHFVKGHDALDSFDSGGLEVLAASIDEFRSSLLAENHTLKWALTDPLFSISVGRGRRLSLSNSLAGRLDCNISTQRPGFFFMVSHP